MTMAKLATMKKKRRNIITSIIGMTMISASSKGFLRGILTSFRMMYPLSIHATGEIVNQFGAIELEVFVDFAHEVAEVVKGDEADDRQGDAGCRGDEGFCNASENLGGVGEAMFRCRAERANHAGNGS